MFIGIQIVSDDGVFHSGQCVVHPPFGVQGYHLNQGNPIIGEQIKVKIGERTETTLTDTDGLFEVTFETIEPGGPFVLSITADKEEIVLDKFSIMVEEDFQWGSGSDSLPVVERQQHRRKLFDGGSPSKANMVATNQLIVVHGVRGGLGTSSLTAAIARELYAKGIPVMVVEATRTGGSLTRMFDIPPAKRGLDSLKELPGDEAGESMLAPLLVEVRKRLEILPLSGSVHAGGIYWDVEAAKNLYRWAVRRSGYVIVDAGSDSSFPLANAALWLANKIFPVTDTDPIGIDSAGRFSLLADDLKWKRVIPGWIVRGTSNGDLEAVTGIKVGFNIPDGEGWDQLAYGKVSNQVKSTVSRILDAAQQMVGGRLF